MNTREKVFEYLKPLPPHKTTIPEIAFKLGLSRDGVAKAVRELEICGRLKIADRKWGDYTVYKIVNQDL